MCIDEGASRSINQLKHVPGDKNPVDVLTKALSVDKHWECIWELGMVVVDNTLLKIA